MEIVTDTDIYGTEWPIMCWCAVKKLLTNTNKRIRTGYEF